jgi:hypothetical protein
MSREVWWARFALPTYAFDGIVNCCDNAFRELQEQ